MFSAHETIFYVDLNALEHNFKYLKSKLETDTKIIAVVKAYAYGHGDEKVSKKLESLGVDYFWVADFEEGVSLRKEGIKLPIIIANPGPKSCTIIHEFSLEPVIYNESLLTFFGESNLKFSIHLKFDTGMNRYGFQADEIDNLIGLLAKYPTLTVKSICSHLSASDDSSLDKFTQDQCAKFEKIKQLLMASNVMPQLYHILNSNGVLRFPDYQNNMVRLGIGLYGVSEDENLIQVGKLESTISQIKHLKKGDRVGYQASFIAKKAIRIGIVPVGYADGLNRRLSNQTGKVMVNGKLAPIIGKISMDSCMIDLSNINIKEGARVVIFGPELPIKSMAQDIDTISYEILATLNRRIKRVYNY